MGHLVNPIALRMGWSSNWIDLFFVDQKYYPQYLHMLFRMRLILPFIFQQHWFERQGGFFCSHFEFTKDYNGLLLKVFFYDGKTEDFFHDIEDYIREDKIYHYQNLTHWNWHERKSKAFFTFYIFFVFFRLFHPFYILLQWPRRLLEHRYIEPIARAFLLFDKRPMLSSLVLYPKPMQRSLRGLRRGPISQGLAHGGSGPDFQRRGQRRLSFQKQNFAKPDYQEEWERRQQQRHRGRRQPFLGQPFQKQNFQRPHFQGHRDPVPAQTFSRQQQRYFSKKSSPSLKDSPQRSNFQGRGERRQNFQKSNLQGRGERRQNFQKSNLQQPYFRRRWHQRQPFKKQNFQRHWDWKRREPRVYLPGWLILWRRAARRLSARLCAPIQFRFFYFYLICRNLALWSDRDHSSQGVKSGELIQLFTFVYCMLSRNNFIFQTVAPYLTFLLNYLTTGYKNPHMQLVQVSFLGITNENITAYFIARYIALKLRQGFTTRDLLNPLRREFSRLLRFQSHERKPFRLPFEFFLRRHSHRNYFSSLFRTLLRKLASFFQKQSYASFLRLKTKLTFDGFLLFDTLLHQGKVPFGRANRPYLRSRYILIFRRLRRYFTYYFYFSLFNYNRILLYYQLFIHNLFKKASQLQYDAAFGEKIPLSFFPHIVPKLLFNNFENYSSWETSFTALYKPSLWQLFLLSFRRKMHRLYSEQSHYYLAKAALAKNRLLRLYNPKTSLERRLGFRGFKIQCLGRFTRRQRSAKLTWIRNGVPLNTLSAYIDYGNFNTVLVNSSINVRVWFHKDEGFEEYYVKVF